MACQKNFYRVQNLEATFEAIYEKIWDKGDQFTAGVDCFICELKSF